MRVLALVVLSVVALVPASAQAARTQVSTEVAGPGPELAGDLAVYQVPSSTDRVIRAAGPGSPPRTLVESPIPRPGPDDDCCFTNSNFAWSVSATRLAVQTYREDSSRGQPGRTNVSLTAGPLPGPRESVYGCSAIGGTSVGPFDVDGDRIAFLRGSCGESEAIVVRNLATGANEATLPAAPGRLYLDVVLAGRYVALAQRAASASQQDDATVVVHDLVLGMDVTAQTTNGNFDLQADGKLVTTQSVPGPDGCPTSLAWYGPGDPTRRVMPFCPDARPRIAGDRVLLRVRNDDQPGDAGDLILSDLSGAARPLVRSEAVGAIGGDYDLDPGGAAYATSTCSPRRSAVYTDDLAPAEPLQVEAECPLFVTSRRLRARRNATVTVRLRCPNGCGGELQLRSRRGNRRLTAYKGFAGGPGAVRVKLRLRRPARRALARTGRLRGRFVVNTGDLRSGSNYVVAQPVTLTGRRR